MRRHAVIAFSVLAIGVGGDAAFSGAAQRTPAEPRLTTEPAAVAPGEALLLRGQGFPKRAQITLFATPPHGESIRIGSAQTGRKGGFSASIRIRVPSDPNRYVVRACHDSCRVAASAQFRIVAP
jgi:hypothetical protein